jgi:hypothetical protein
MAPSGSLATLQASADVLSISTLTFMVSFQLVSARVPALKEAWSRSILQRNALALPIARQLEKNR